MREIGIIDDGICLEPSRIRRQITRGKEGWINLPSQKVQKDSHGSCIARIIEAYQPDVFFSGIQVLDVRGYGELPQWIEAVEMAGDSSVEIWNISNGLTVFFQFEQVARAVKKTVSRGKLLIAARSNGDLFTVPACLPEVIGVAYDETLPANTMMVNPRREQDINIRANLDFPLAGKEGIFIRRACSSYQTAAVTGLLARKYIGNIDDVLSGWKTDGWLEEYLQPRPGDDYRLLPWKDSEVADDPLRIPVIVISCRQGQECLECMAWGLDLAESFRKEGSYTVTVMETPEIFSRRDACNGKVNHNTQPNEKQSEMYELFVECRRAEEKVKDCLARLYQKYRCDLLIYMECGEKRETGGMVPDLWIDLRQGIMITDESPEELPFFILSEENRKEWGIRMQQVRALFE